jgi:hypothetical protein
MQKGLTGAVLCLGLTMLALGNGAKAQQPWQLVWSDEFHSTRVAPVDSRYWTHDTGGWGWGNTRTPKTSQRMHVGSTTKHFL